MQALVSVIIPIYRVEQYLKRCVASVRQQSYSNLEIILVDDGSPDNCGRLCDEYAELDPRIKVLHKANGGLSSARNAGLEVMTGEYLMFVDSDDYLALDCVEYLVGMLERFSTQISIGNYVETRSGQYEFERGFERGCEPKRDCSSERLELISGREACARLYGGASVQYISSCFKLYARSLFAGLRFPEGLVHEDLGTTYKALYACDQVIVSQRVVYAYCYNPESITKRPKKKNYQDLCTILEEQLQFYEERGDFVLEAWVKNCYCLQAAACYLPKGYYEQPKVLVQKAKQMYKGVWGFKEIPFKERLKGWMSAYLCAFTAHMMKALAKRRNRRG